MANVLFLAWESPWPAHGGAALRTWNLLRQIARGHTVDLLVLQGKPLAPEQLDALRPHVRELLEVRRLEGGWRNRLATLGEMVRSLRPYHPALLVRSLRADAQAQLRLARRYDAVFTNMGHWGTLVADRPAPEWILNQCDADIQFWQAYAAQAGNPLVKVAAQVNYLLARGHFPRIYANVGQVVCVSQEDAELTRPFAAQTPVGVVANGIEGTFYVPQREQARAGAAQLLFTGTSARRNVTALRDFADHVLPQVLAAYPAARLLVAGNFSAESQAAFADVPAITFTGRVADMRPYFDESDIFVAPFRDAHGSKLKVAEAMAMGMAVVSTQAGVRGFPVRHGESVLVAQDDADFARQIIRLIEAPAERARIGTAARALALAELDWDLLGVRVRALVDEVAARAAAPGINSGEQPEGV